LNVWNNIIAGGRTADEIVSWLLKKTGPVAKDIKYVDDAKGFIDASSVAVIGFFKVILSCKHFLCKIKL
jgi:protein disulfide-isomerase A1